MTRPSDCTVSPDRAALLADQGLDALPEVIRIISNASMQAEREQHRRAAADGRPAEHRGYANGDKPKTVTTLVGAITFKVPQVRDGRFYPTALEKGLRSERAFRLALAERYVQGVSTRKVAAITEQRCGVKLASTQVSRAAAQLEPILEQWRQRPLGVCPYLSLDARYEKVRVEGQVRDAAVLLALGVRADGKRSLLGVSVALSEQEAPWRQFLGGLVARGLTGVHLIISDAQALLARTVQKYAKPAPKLTVWPETALPEGLTVFAFPAAQRLRLRTVHGLERFNQELRRRTRVVGVFPNAASCLRLITALAMETSDDWEAGRTYLTLAA